MSDLKLSNQLRDLCVNCRGKKDSTEKVNGVY